MSTYLYDLLLLGLFMFLTWNFAPPPKKKIAPGAVVPAPALTLLLGSILLPSNFGQPAIRLIIINDRSLTIVDRLKTLSEIARCGYMPGSLLHYFVIQFPSSGMESSRCMLADVLLLASAVGQFQWEEISFWCC